MRKRPAMPRKQCGCLRVGLREDLREGRIIMKLNWTMTDLPCAECKAVTQHYEVITGKVARCAICSKKIGERERAAYLEQERAVGAAIAANVYD
jgi:hypothetical protein